HDLVLHPERVGEALELRQAHVQRDLAAFEAGRHLVTGLGALGAATGGLALGRLTTTHAGLGGLGAGGRTQVVQLDRHDQSTSFTVTRCGMALTMPRISGRSSTTETSPMRLSPSERSVARWFCSRPIAERTWVTSSLAIRRSPPQEPGPSHGWPSAARAASRPRRPGHGARRPPRATRANAGPPPSRGRC